MKTNNKAAKKNVKSFAWNRKNVVIISAVAVFLVIGSVWGGVKLYGKPKPVKIDLGGKTEEQIRAYIESDEFKKLDRDTQRQYGRAAMEQAIEKRMNEYFQAAPEEKTAYLDKVIDEMQERMRQRPMREVGAGGRDSGGGEHSSPRVSGQNQGDGGGGSQGGGGQARGGSPRRGPEGMRARMESSSPEQRAKMTEFFEAMRNRMKDRGLDFRPGGGGR